MIIHQGFSTKKRVVSVAILFMVSGLPMHAGAMNDQEDQLKPVELPSLEQLVKLIPFPVKVTDLKKEEQEDLQKATEQLPVEQLEKPIVQQPANPPIVRKSWMQNILFVSFSERNGAVLYAAGAIGILTIGAVTYVLYKNGTLAKIEQLAREYPYIAAGISGVTAVSTAVAIMLYNGYSFSKIRGLFSRA
jgi:hypothetical protein